MNITHKPIRGESTLASIEHNENLTTEAVPGPWRVVQPHTDENESDYIEIHDPFGRTARVYGEIDDPETQATAQRIAEAGEPRFLTQCMDTPEARAEVSGLGDLIFANQEGAPDLCEWAETAEVGDSFVVGGGAAPVFKTWRVS